MSLTEAECLAMAEGENEAMYLTKRCLDVLATRGSLTLRPSRGAKVLEENPMSPLDSKQIDVRRHYIFGSWWLRRGISRYIIPGTCFFRERHSMQAFVIYEAPGRYLPMPVTHTRYAIVIGLLSILRPFLSFISLFLFFHIHLFLG